MDHTTAIIVTSPQLYPNSLPYASLADGNFLEFLLDRIAARFPQQPKVISMSFENLQKLDEEMVKFFESKGFCVFLGDWNHDIRLVKAARHVQADTAVEIKVDCPLTVLTFVEQMVEAHHASGADLTLCHNWALNLSPVIYKVDSLALANTLAHPSSLEAFGLTEAVKQAEPVHALMCANPGYFKTRFFEVPITWPGAALVPHSELFTRLKLEDGKSLITLRDLIFTINADDLRPEDIIDYLLIKNMQTAWGRSHEFDTKRIVADQAQAKDRESYRAFSQEEVDWFVFNDAVFLDGRDLKAKNLLEVGCGHGRLLDILADSFAEVHGIDITPERYMEGRYRLRHRDNAHIVLGDGRSLRQFSDNSFDFVICHGVFVHINSKTIINNYLAEMFRVLRPGGRMKFDIYEGRDIFGVTTRDFGLGARYEKSELDGVLKGCGLNVIDISEVVTRQFSRNPEDGKEYSNLPLKQFLVICDKPA